MAECGQVTMIIDADRCIGVGQCELLEPAVFRVDDDDGLAQIVGPALLSTERAEIVVDRCPSGAISFELDRAGEA